MSRHRLSTRQVARRLTLGSGPLKRTSDRLECLARVVLASVLLSAVVLALAVATAVSTRGHAEALAEAADRHQVSAELLEDAVPLEDASGGVPALGRATAVWTSPSGGERTAAISVPAAARAGSTHTVWIDRDGGRTTRPLSNGDVAWQAFGSALLTYLGTTLVASAGYCWVRALLNRSRSRRWTAEWAVVGPEWTGKVP